MAEQATIEVQARTVSGLVQSFRVSEILAIDGVPYRSPGDFGDLREHVVHVEARVQGLEAILGSMLAGPAAGAEVPPIG